jgi:hypothetical protein
MQDTERCYKRAGNDYGLRKLVHRAYNHVVKFEIRDQRIKIFAFRFSSNPTSTNFLDRTERSLNYPPICRSYVMKWTERFN